MSKGKIRLLFVRDDTDDEQLVELLRAAAGRRCDMVGAEQLSDALDALHVGRLDLVLLELDARETPAGTRGELPLERARQLPLRILALEDEPPDALSAIQGVAQFERVRPVVSPRWDAERRELLVGDVVVKQFRQPSPNQELILAVFEEEDWPAKIADPLPPHPELCPKERLRATIRSLNRRQLNKLLHFSGDGTGLAVRWEWTSP